MWTIRNGFAVLGLVTGVVMVGVGMAGVGSALAGTPMDVQVDRSQLVQLDSDPGTIIVGNPSIADVSLNGRQLFIHGHSYGETNLMVFDANNNKIADFDLTVSHDSANQLTMFIGSAQSGTSRFTYSCAPNCEVNMMVGDNSQSFQKVISDNRAKNDYAQGVKTSDLGTKISGPVTGAAPAQ